MRMVAEGRGASQRLRCGLAVAGIWRRRAQPSELLPHRDCRTRPASAGRLSSRLANLGDGICPGHLCRMPYFEAASNFQNHPGSASQKFKTVCRRPRAESSNPSIAVGLAGGQEAAEAAF